MPHILPPALHEKGYLLEKISLPSHVLESILSRNWNALDQAMTQETQRGGVIFEALQKWMTFDHIEFIISIRSSLLTPDEDGIWHDDGSRLLAFSLSLTLQPDTIEGGVLEIRKRDRLQTYPSHGIPTPPWGTLIVFATGLYGFEHKINRVTQGERIIIAGWCTSQQKESHSS